MKTKATISSLLLLALAQPLWAQSAENFDPNPSTEVKEVSPAPSGPDDSAIAELVSKPSRYVALDQKSYTEALYANFAIKARATGPFGRHQDPNYKKPEPTQKPKQKQALPGAPEVPFKNIIAGIDIGMIIPGKKIFMVAGRTFKEGDRITVDTGGGALLPIHVTSVTGRHIEFRNGNTNEIFRRPNFDKPEGFERDPSKGALPSGLTDPNKDAPLPLQIPVNQSNNTLSSSR